MRNKFIGKLFFHAFRGFILVCFASLVCLESKAEIKPTSIIVRPEMAQKRRDTLAHKLQIITGWTELKFDQEGYLRLSEAINSTGSQTAREFLKTAISDKRLMVIEDASNRIDVTFCDVIEGRWVKSSEGKPPVYVVRIDFADFEKIIGHKKILESFNEGWGLLHEISHVVRGSVDAEHLGKVGECEELMNQMRREQKLAERAEYFYTYYPFSYGSVNINRIVRLAFDLRQPETGKKKRYWLIWDVRVVGAGMVAGGREASQNVSEK